MSGSGQKATSQVHRALVRCTPETGHVGVRRACQECADTVEKVESNATAKISLKSARAELWQ